MNLADVDEATGDRSCRGHLRRHEMGAAEPALTALEIAVRRGSATLARAELIGVHGKAHGTARLAPLKARRFEDGIQALFFGLGFHQP